MRQKPGTRKSHGEKVVKDIRRATRKQYSAEEKIRIVLDSPRWYAVATVICIDLNAISLAVGSYRFALYRWPLVRH